MVEVTCEACPSLAIPHLGVQFVGGRASVTEDQSEALKPYVVHGVSWGEATSLPGDVAPEEAAADPGPPVAPKPRGRSKASDKPFS